MLGSNRSAKLQEIWFKAQKHRQASQVGTPVSLEDYELCSCCDQVVEQQLIPMCEHTKQFQTYGFGYPLWFSFLKYCIVLMLVLIASKTANEIYMGATQNQEFCYSAQALAQYNGSETVPAQTHQTIQENYDSSSNIQQSNQIIQNPISQNAHQAEDLDSSQEQNTHVPTPIEPSHIQRHLQTLHKVGSSSSTKVKCTSFMVFLSIFKGQKMTQNTFLKVIEFIIHLVALLAVRNMILKEEQYYDERTTLISKYSIIIHNLPNVYGLKRKVRTLFEEQFGMFYGQDHNEIKDFIYVFKDEGVTSLSQEKEQLQDKILKAQAQEDQETEKCLKQRLEVIEEHLDKKIDSKRKEIDNDNINCNKMIVVMRTEGDKASVLYSFKEAMKQGKNFNEYFYDVDKLSDQMAFKPTNIHMKQASQPNEIIWQHIDESDEDRKLLIVQGYVFTFVFLGVVAVIFYFIMLAKTHLFLMSLQMGQNDPGNPNMHTFSMFATFIVFFALFGVVLFNKFVMGNVLHKIVHMEHHAYTDKQNHSFALKYALGMFFTTALMTLAVEALTYNNFYSHPYGVIEEETIMFFVTAFIIPLIWWIHPYNCVKNLRRKKKYGKLMSQKEANQLVEFYPYMLGKRYAEVFEIVWFTFLYSELIPLGSFLMLVGLILYYWVDKYNFLRKSAVNTRVSGKMAILGLKSLDATLFLSPAGQLLFEGILHNRFDYPALIFVIIGIIYTLLPTTSFIWQLNGQKFLIQEKPFEENKMKFKETYYSMHPIYKLTHKQEIEKHRQIVQEYYKHDLKKVKHYGTGRGNYHRKTTLTTKRLMSPIESETIRI